MRIYSKAFSYGNIKKIYPKPASFVKMIYQPMLPSKFKSIVNVDGIYFFVKIMTFPIEKQIVTNTCLYFVIDHRQKVVK